MSESYPEAALILGLMGLISAAVYYIPLCVVVGKQINHSQKLERKELLNSVLSNRDDDIDIVIEKIENIYR